MRTSKSSTFVSLSSRQWERLNGLWVIFINYKSVWQIFQYPWRRMYRRSLMWTLAFCTFRQLVWLFTSFADLECSAAGRTSADRLMLWLWFLKVYFFCFWYQRKKHLWSLLLMFLGLLWLSSFLLSSVWQLCNCCLFQSAFPAALSALCVVQ